MKYPYRCKISTTNVDEIRESEITNAPVYHYKWKNVVFDLEEIESYRDSMIKLSEDKTLDVCYVEFKSGNYFIINETFEEFDKKYCEIKNIQPFKKTSENK